MMRRVIAPILFFIIVLSAWELGVRALYIPDYLLPTPTRILSVFSAEASLFARHAAVTMIESIAGFLLANLAGFIIAVIFAHSTIAERAFMPYAIALKTTPIIAMAPLLVLWLGTGMISKIAASALICFFPILVNATRGLRSVEPEALDLFESLAASRWQVFTKLRLPNSLPLVFSALKISTSLCVVGAIVGEFIGSREGIGYVILISSYHLETARMFAAVISSALIGIIFYGFVSAVERITLYWQKPMEETT